MMGKMEIKPCPWKRTRMSPNDKNIRALMKYIDTNSKPESMLEIGAGRSTWYLHQLNFDKYVAVETFKPVVDLIASLVLSNFLLVDKWTSIPSMEYQYIFIDSHVGGDTNKYQRERPLIYALDNNLLKKDAMIIVHDYHKIKMYRDNIGSMRSMNFVAWFEMEKKYNLKIIKEFGNEFCVYTRG